jgi:small subunit ribosomal protein S3
MGQKTSPIGFRTGVTLGWQSTWFAPKATYGDCLVEDQKIREYVDRRFNQRMPKGAVARVEIIRTRNEVNVTLHSGRPGVVIGPRGGEVDRVREELEGLVSRKVTVNVVEIKDPELNATLVEQGIAEQLGKRASFRRTMKQQCEGAMNAGAKGVKIMCSGRLAGSEMARRETQKMGSIPLHTLDANVDYATATARTTYGAIGVKVWIYKGKFGEEIEPVRRPPQARRRPPRRPPQGRSGPPAPSAPSAAPAPSAPPAPSAAPGGQDGPSAEAGPSAEG